MNHFFALRFGLPFFAVFGAALFTVFVFGLAAAFFVVFFLMVMNNLRSRSMGISQLNRNERVNPRSV